MMIREFILCFHDLFILSCFYSFRNEHPYVRGSEAMHTPCQPDPGSGHPAPAVPILYSCYVHPHHHHRLLCGRCVFLCIYLVVFT